MIEFAIAAALMAQDAETDEHLFVLSPLSESCDSLESGQQHNGCHLVPADGRNLLISFVFEEGEAAARGRMIVQGAQVAANTDGERQRCQEGCVLQTFDFDVQSYVYPFKEDLNSDGYEDILIPLATRGVSTEYAIFMGTEDAYLAEPYSVIGHEVVAAQDGLFAVHAGMGGDVFRTEFHALEEGRLYRIASVEVDYSRPGDMDCREPDPEELDEDVYCPEVMPTCRLIEGGQGRGASYYCGLLSMPAENADSTPDGLFFTLPDCTGLENGTLAENCRFEIGTNIANNLDVIFTLANTDEGQSGQVEVRGDAGEAVQVLEFRTHMLIGPSLRDVNADGLYDILVPTEAGNVNISWEVFMGIEGGFLHQPWRVNGFAIESANHDGLIIARARSSAAESYAEFYRFDGERIVGEATVFLSYMNVENVDDGPDCSLVDGGEYEGEHIYCSLALSP